MTLLAEGGMSCNDDVRRERVSVAADAPDVQVVNINDARHGRISETMVCNSTLLGAPSSRIFRLSLTMPTDDHKTMAAMAMESAGSIQLWPVTMMAQPPAITAAVERVSPTW